jgi:NADH-quinone oxidoreductase subunit N
VALVRLLGFVVEGTNAKGLADDLVLGTQVPTLLWILAAVTMTLGNVLALLQDNLKRLLAYSSVAHAGYMLIGLAVAPVVLETLLPGGLPAVLFYLVAYGAMTVGAFAVVSYLSTPQRPVETVDDLAGLSRSHPGVALLMALFLFSLLGLPLTAGFVGKFLLFLAAFDVPPQDPSSSLFRWLVLIAALNSAVGGWYYLRVIAVMYLRSPIRPFQVRRAWAGLAAMWICAAVTLGFGIYPAPLWTLARMAAARYP